jgi:GGDEF domain-containing protein
MSGVSGLLRDRRALGGVAGLVAVLAFSLLAVTSIDSSIVVSLAVVAAFSAGLVIVPPMADAGQEAERRVVGEHLDRQVRNGRKLSILDPQTAMLQRWYFELRVAEEARRCRRYGTSMAVMFVRVNSEGLAGQEWTQEDEIDFVQTFGRTLRSVDLAARIGDREYAVCLPHTTEEGADTAAARLLKNSGGYSVTAQMAFCPRDGLDYEALAGRAEPYTPGLPRTNESAAPGGNLQLLKLLGESPAGEIPVPAGQTMRSAKAKLRRASRRAGIDIRIWEENGAVHFERLEPMRQEGAA